jgi:hypothetical protein
MTRNRKKLKLKSNLSQTISRSSQMNPSPSHRQATSAEPTARDHLPIQPACSGKRLETPTLREVSAGASLAASRISHLSRL